MRLDYLEGKGICNICNGLLDRLSTDNNLSTSIALNMGQ